MSKNAAEHLLKVERAAQFLLRALQATVTEAMRVARFSDDDIANLNVQKQIVRRLPGRKKPATSLVVTAPVSSVACSPMVTGVSVIMSGDNITCSPPKRVRTRKTAPAAMKNGVENLKQKRHYSAAHKEATQLSTGEENQRAV
jgi:hypothetical protein